MNRNALSTARRKTRSRFSRQTATRTSFVAGELVESDLVVGQRVVVLTQTIPARPLPAKTLRSKNGLSMFPTMPYVRRGLTMLAANRLLHPETSCGDELDKAKLIKRGQTVAVESLAITFESRLNWWPSRWYLGIRSRCIEPVDGARGHDRTSAARSAKRL